MNRKLNFYQQKKEVKKIKAKLQTTSLVAITVLLLIVSTVNTADAESTQMIQGSIDGISISIMHDGITNIIILEKDGIKSEHWDGVIKIYNSGAFVIKNIESGIVLFAHPIGNDQYRLVVITNDMVYRLIGVSEIISELDVVTSLEEPVSSIGTDISNWDIPTIGRSDPQIIIPTESHNPDSLDMIASVPFNVEYKHDFRFDITAIDTQIKSTIDQRLSDVSVDISMINPIGETIEIWNGLTDKNGYFGNVWYVPDNQMLGEYKLHISIDKENYTSILQIVSFFVQPIEDDGGSSCPVNYVLDNTGVCVITP